MTCITGEESFKWVYNRASPHEPRERQAHCQHYLVYIAANSSQQRHLNQIQNIGKHCAVNHSGETNSNMAVQKLHTPFILVSQKKNHIYISVTAEEGRPICLPQQVRVTSLSTLHVWYGSLLAVCVKLLIKGN